MAQAKAFIQDHRQKQLTLQWVMELQYTQRKQVKSFLLVGVEALGISSRYNMTMEWSVFMHTFRVLTLLQGE
jgi:hypothetical protein